MDFNLKINIPSLEEFYRECENVEGGDQSEIDEINSEDNAYFRGLKNEDILKYKWNYTKGLDQLKSIEKPIQLGGRKRKYEYDENDGDDLNFDRYLDGMPCLRRRVPIHGNGNGKFVKLHVSICENCWCGPSELLQRAYTAMRIIDMLESQGYQLQVSAYASNRNPGALVQNGIYKEVDHLDVEVIIKAFDEPLIKGKILTAISPWFFRYWMFKFYNAKFKMNPGYGQSYRPEFNETTSDIYIQTGEALTDKDGEMTIERIMKLFDKEE